MAAGDVGKDRNKGCVLSEWWRAAGSLQGERARVLTRRDDPKSVDNGTGRDGTTHYLDLGEAEPARLRTGSPKNLSPHCTRTDPDGTSLDL
jgi:hypothetical protein